MQLQGGTRGARASHSPTPARPLGWGRHRCTNHARGGHHDHRPWDAFPPPHLLTVLKLTQKVAAQLVTVERAVARPVGRLTYCDDV